MEKYLVLNTSGNYKTIDGQSYDSTYEMLSQNVEGSIEHAYSGEKFAKKGIDLWINDEGKINNLQPTMAIKCDGQLYDILCGNIVFSRFNELGETIPLKENDTQFIINELTKEMVLFPFSDNTENTLYRVIPVLDISE